MNVTYSIQVCNESRELYSLLNFLIKVIDGDDNIHVVVDSLHKTDKVDKVIENFKDKITVFERPFDNFHENATYHTTVSTGDYTFLIDADEMPQEMLIKNIKNVIDDEKSEIIWVPRINIHPGATQEFIEMSKYNVNEVGWINWPDYQSRIYKKCEHVKWSNETHIKLEGSDKVTYLKPIPSLALWHIKSIEKQLGRWDPKTDNVTTPLQGNLYYELM
jgi:hypothetical protein